ncbi:nucleolin-like isoform X1 [Lytechinus pictus]|uniref:nucleolin-like isoform X1 n=1 Tax=Lytechinus pictus TaxID=7653 RepID=UPI0030BA0A62
MGCMCCCFKSPKEEEPSSLVKKGDDPSGSPRKSYGAITIQEETPASKLNSPPRKSPEELLYSDKPKSARVQSPELKKDGEASTSGASPEKRTLADIAVAAQKVTSAFQDKKKSRTSSPSPTVDTKGHAEAEEYVEQGVDVPLISSGGDSNVHDNASMESDTCHSIGEDEEEEEESEDARILRMMSSVPPAPSSDGSQSQLVPKSPSPGSSSQDVSMDKKQSKAKDFMKKAGKSMKKAKKKVGKGMDKMIHHKKKEESRSQDDTRERADSTSTNETSSSSNNQFKRVSSERMKSKYARDRLAALEKKREEEASHKTSQGITDPRQAALERGEKLGELEDKTEQMRDQAASFAHNVSLLKGRHASTS